MDIPRGADIRKRERPTTRFNWNRRWIQLGLFSTLIHFSSDDKSAEFCSSGFRACHSRATCADFETGFCCVCQSGFFGNGKNCLSEGEFRSPSSSKMSIFSAVIPIRVNGKVTGTINGVDLTDLDLQAYVVPADGRTYTAISVVPPNVGYDMQSVTILGSTIGWLFARPVKGALNGYQLTGTLNTQNKQFLKIF